MCNRDSIIADMRENRRDIFRTKGRNGKDLSRRGKKTSITGPYFIKVLYYRQSA